MPVHCVEHTDKRAQRSFQRGLVANFVGEQPQGGADERVGFAELFADLIEPVGEFDVARPGHQQAEGDGLGVAVGKLLVVRFGKEKVTPVGGEIREGGVFLGQLFSNFVSQQAAQPGRNFGQFRG